MQQKNTKKESKTRQAAKQLLDFINAGAIPDFLTDEVSLAVERAGRIKGLAMPTFDEPEEEQLDLLERFIEETEFFDCRKREGRPEPLSFDEIRSLARNLVRFITEGDDEAAEVLMVLMREIIEHPFNSSHVEAVAMTIADELFTLQPAFSEAQEKFITEQRAKLLAKIAN